MFLNCGIGEDSWESLGQQGDPTRILKEISPEYWKDRCWTWNCNTLATWCEELTHWKSPWCWERLKAGEGDGRAWDGWMASPTRWTWVWAGSGSWWWTGKPGVLWCMGSQSRTPMSDWTELSWVGRYSCFRSDSGEKNASYGDWPLAPNTLVHIKEIIKNVRIIGYLYNAVF